MKNRNDARNPADRNYPRSRSSTQRPSRESAQQQRNQHPSDQQNRGQLGGNDGKEGNYAHSEQGRFDAWGNTINNEKSHLNSSYGDTLRGDYGYGRPEKYTNDNAVQQHSQYPDLRSQANGRPRGNGNAANAGWDSGAQGYGRKFQAVYARDGSMPNDTRHAEDALHKSKDGSGRK